MTKRFHAPKQVSPSTDTPLSLNGFAHSARAKIFLAIFSLSSLSGCATVGGIFGIGEEAQQRAAVDAEATPERLANTYLLKAREASSNRQIQRNNYRQAIAYYREALSIFPPNHPSRKTAEVELSKVESSLRDFEKPYRDAQAELDKALALPSFTVESIDQLYVLFYRLQILRAALGKEDKSLYEKAMGEARRRLAAKDYMTAYYLCDIAQKVDFSEGEIVRTTQVTKEDMKVITVANDKKEAEMARRKAEVDRLSQLALVAFNERKMEEVRHLVGEVRKLETKDFKAANKLASKINNMSRSGRGSPVAKKPIVVATAPAPVVSEAPASPSQEEIEDLEQVRLTLDNLVGQFNAGDKFEAIAGLEEALSEFSGSANLSLLNKQREVWGPDRKTMISQIREKADKLFIDEDPDALGAYKSLNRLNPSEDIRRQALERIKTLEGILGK